MVPLLRETQVKLVVSWLSRKTDFLSQTAFEKIDNAGVTHAGSYWRRAHGWRISPSLARSTLTTGGRDSMDGWTSRSYESMTCSGDLMETMTACWPGRSSWRHSRHLVSQIIGEFSFIIIISFLHERIVNTPQTPSSRLGGPHISVLRKPASPHNILFLIARV